MTKIKGDPYPIYSGGGTKDAKKPKIGHRLPEFRINSNDVPEVEKMSVGNPITMTITVNPVEIKQTTDREVEGEMSMVGPSDMENDDNKGSEKKVTVARVEVTDVSISSTGKTLGDKIGADQIKDKNKI